jgi:cyclopropane-fatty-acyl-phospholipid synthase
MKRLIRHKIITHFLRAMPELAVGQLTLVTPKGVVKRFTGKQQGVQAELRLHSWDVLVNAARRGDIGLGEDYIAGKWESADIGALIELFLRNMQSFEDFAHGNIVNRAVFRIYNALRRNHKAGSKRNIKAHYDVGNDFYALWLDETMTYSSALYAGQELSLAAAQQAKYQRMLEKAAPHGNAHILEIGCGWGGFAEHAARAGHHVTALTISQAQYAFADTRLQRANVRDKVNLLLQDYRDAQGTFDAIASIEMFEAVGEQYWGDYFRTIKARLKKDGHAVVQTITIDDALFDDYRTRSDFIRQYTFPGGLLPSLKRFREEAEKAGLRCKDTYAFGLDYAKTLSTWLERFDAAQPQIRAMGYSDAFIRSWRFYLSMCIGAFCAGRTNVVQIELVHIAV